MGYELEELGDDAPAQMDGDQTRFFTMGSGKPMNVLCRRWRFFLSYGVGKRSWFFWKTLAKRIEAIEAKLGREVQRLLFLYFYAPSVFEIIIQNLERRSGRAGAHCRLRWLLR